VKRIDVVVIGGGQAGLAMSRCLSDRGIDHVVFERGRIAERWHSERWDSLRLLTPNWQSRLPGFAYDGGDPDGFMTAPEVAAFLDRYADVIHAPVEADTAVMRVAPSPGGFAVTTNHGDWTARAIVIATGYCDVPFVPKMAAKLPPAIHQLTPSDYRRPSQLPDGGVLVVGASSSGIQIADELRRSGRTVAVAVGGHTRVPRRYRNRDIMWWLDRAGLMDEALDAVHDVEQSKRQPSLQLVGGPEHRTLNLAVLQDRGVQILGRLARVDGHRVAFDDDLVATTVAADAKLATLIARLDEFAVRSGLDADVAPPEPFVPIWRRFTDAATAIDLDAAGIRTVVWAVGYRRQYPWLQVPVLDANGEVRHDGGVTPYPGVYVIGLRFLRRRNSNFIDGVGKDADALAEHVRGFLGVPERVAMATGV
jgi:putative flavoprotein involved in K+ transport